MPTETALLYKLHKAFILKDEKLIEPYLSPDFAFVGRKPSTFWGATDQESLLNIIDAAKYCGSSHEFKSEFHKPQEVSWGKKSLRIEYIIYRQTKGVFFLHVDALGGLLSRLHVVDMVTPEFFCPMADFDDFSEVNPETIFKIHQPTM